MKNLLLFLIALSLPFGCRKSGEESHTVTYEVEGTIAEFRFMKDGEMRLFRETAIEAKLDTTFVQKTGDQLALYARGYYEPNDSGPGYNSLRAKVFINGGEIMNHEDET